MKRLPINLAPCCNDRLNPPPILLKNCSRLGQRGFAGGHKPSPERVAFNSGRSMRSNFAAVPAPLRRTSFSTVSADLSRSDPTTTCRYRPDKSRGQLPLCSSLTAAPTSTPRRTVLHPRRIAAKLRKWHTDRALIQPQSIWWHEGTSSCRTDRRYSQRSRKLRHRSDRPCWAG